ncbi:MAG: Type 1 glutamine amidotransferase-like domain-containing protein [Thermoanaerobaculia bacterium]|nr:Type 1 glutamine amidotransferase-like domain-containing protein [Thermoanaerobaculia bacterium]
MNDTQEPESSPDSNPLPSESEAPRIERPPGGGWIALVGGGEFSFGETAEADSAWLAHTNPGTVGFVPTASGSTDYGDLFAEYLRETFERKVETVPVFRGRDARRRKNCDRLAGLSAVYLGGGVVDHLVDTITGTTFAEALLDHLRGGGVVVAIAAAAQALGAFAHSPLEREAIFGLAWLRGGVIEPNFDPGHDRRLRRTMEEPGVTFGLGIPAGSAILLGPDGVIETIGVSFLLDDSEAEFRVLGEG